MFEVKYQLVFSDINVWMYYCTQGFSLRDYTLSIDLSISFPVQGAVK